MTIRDLIATTLRRLRVTGAGETPDASDMNDALMSLKFMLNGWDTQMYLIPNVTTISFNILDTSYSFYTIGEYKSEEPPANHIESHRVLDMLSLNIRSESGMDYQVNSMTLKQYQNIPNKGNVAIPSRYYYEKNYPLGTINFDCAPSLGDSIIIKSLTSLNDYVKSLTLSTEIELPSGYANAIMLNLCVEIAPEYGQELPASIGALALKAMRQIKKNNSRDLRLTMDSGLTAQTNRGNFGFYDINNGY